MLSWLLCLSFYAIAAAAGAQLAWRLPLRSFLERCLAAGTLGAVQVLLAIQALALFRLLRGDLLFALNAAAGVAVVLVARRWGWAGGPSILEDLSEATRRAAALFRENPVSAVMVAIAAVAVVTLAAIGYAGLPMTDIYHFTMPLYWREYGTLTDFPTSDPRHIGVAFASEGLSCPGLLYARSLVPFAFFAGVGGLWLIWLVAALAWRMGFSAQAALAAGALAPAYFPVSRAILGPSPDMMLGAAWFLGAIYFLVEAARAEERKEVPLALATITFLMGCGSKNIIALQTPGFGLLALWLLGREMWTWRRLCAVTAGALLGLCSSSMLWNYTSNYLAFHDVKGPWLLGQNMARDLSPPAVWTREVRDFVGTFADPVWLPHSLHPQYEHFLRASVSALGGRSELADDDPYFSFTGEMLRPGTGVGIAGLGVLLPSLIGGLLWLWPRFRGGRRLEAWSPPVLALLTVFALAFCFALVRTPRIGVARWMVSWFVLGAPLAAIWFERRWLRLAGCGILTLSVTAYLLFGIGMVARRYGETSGGGLLSHLGRLQNNRSLTVSYQWRSEPPTPLLIHEDWTQREYYLLLRQRLPPGSVCAFYGTRDTSNAEEFFLFGADFSNRVYNVLDCRDYDRLLPIPAAAEYLVSDHGDFSGLDYRALGFAPLLEITRDGRAVFAALVRKR